MADSFSSRSDSSAPVAPSPRAGSNDGTDMERLVARLIEELATSWQQGKCVGAEELLARHPELTKHPEAAVDLIYEEVCLRQEYGQELTRSALLQRFPQWRTQLEILLDCHQLLEVGAAPRYPVVGESVGDFHLVAKLGQGGHGCVFLARQTSLADRPVVIKFTPLLGQEHLSLARLQHTHIMPLFSVLEDPERNLRALCMPYFGGATLAQLLKSLAAQPFARRTGQDVLNALDEAQAAAGVPLPSRDPAREVLARASYVQAICWIGACLADALKYAHERGLVHLDVKPSNVLLTADAQPMLLDFHLAHQVIEPGRQEPTWIGGTPTYMSPEQRVALQELRGQRPISVTVDGRSDLYSLGLFLYEALGGPVAGGFASQSVSRSAGRTSGSKGARPVAGSNAWLSGEWAVPALPRLERCRPEVGAGLADIVAKCLAPDPRARYPDAGALAADLGRHLSDLPLRGVSNRSLTERWRKWRRRRPHALALLVMVLLVLTGALASCVLVFTSANQQLAQARTALIQGSQQLQDRQYEEAILTFTQGISQIEHLPGTRDLVGELDKQLRRTLRAKAIDKLHRLADRFRPLYGVKFLSPEEVAEAELFSLAFWERRDLILDRLVPASGRRERAPLGGEPRAEPARADELTESELEQQIRADLLDLAILGINLRVHGAVGDARTTHEEALRVLRQVEAVCGASPVLCYERQRHAEALGLKEEAQEAARQRAQLPPRTAWEHYALGRALMEEKELTEAARLLQRAIDLEPHGLWPRFYQGICAYRLGNYEDAVLAFTMCAAWAPEVAGCLYNRALAYEGWGRPERALWDYDKALALDPHLGAAALNRGILYSQAKRYAEAYADLERALKEGVDPATVHYNLALVHLAQEQRTEALASLKRALQQQPDHEEARALYEQLQSER